MTTIALMTAFASGVESEVAKLAAVAKAKTDEVAKIEEVSKAQAIAKTEAAKVKALKAAEAARAEALVAPKTKIDKEKMRLRNEILQLTVLFHNEDEMRNPTVKVRIPKDNPAFDNDREIRRLRRTRNSWIERINGFRESLKSN